MTGRWSLSRGFSSPVYLVFLAPSCVSLSLSLTSVFCRGTPYVYQPVESVATRLVPSDGRNDQDGHLPGRKRYPSNFFFSFFCVGDWSRTLCAFAASFCGLLFDRFRVKDRLACKRYKSLTIRLCSHFFFFNIIVYDNLKLFCFLFSLSFSLESKIKESLKSNNRSNYTSFIVYLPIVCSKRSDRNRRGEWGWYKKK